MGKGSRFFFTLPYPPEAQINEKPVETERNWCVMNCTKFSVKT